MEVIDPGILPAPDTGFVVTHFITSHDVARSAQFYQDIFGAEPAALGEPSILKLANSWIIINVGGGPTEDKPTVHLAPPQDPDHHTSFLNLRVADIHSLYHHWKAKGAEFITPPQDRGAETRCYIRDPDGYIIEVGQMNPPQ